jgi:hypothetical protein
MMNTSLSYRAGDPFAEHLLTVLQDLAGASAKVLEAGAAGDDAATRAAIDQIRQLRAVLQDIGLDIKQQVDNAPASTQIAIGQQLATIQQSEQFIAAWCGRYDGIQTQAQLTLTAEGRHALIDKMIPATWHWGRDVLTFTDTVDVSLIKTALERGQKRIVVFCNSAPADDHKLAKVCYLLDKKDAYSFFLSTDYGEPKRLVYFNGLSPEDETTLTGKNTKYAEFLTEFTQAFKNYNVNKNTIRFFSNRWLMQGLDNLPAVAEHATFSCLKEKFINTPLVIISPGPSLDKNIHLLKQLKGKALLMAPAQGAMALYRAGVIPDAIVVADPADIIYLMEGIAVEQVETLLLGVACHPSFYERFKGKIVTFNVNEGIDNWISDIFNDTAHVGSGGSVSTAIFTMGLYLQCNPIMLVGQDLALTDGKVYCSNSADGGMSFKLNKEGDAFTYDNVTPGYESLLENGGLNSATHRDEALSLPGYYGGTVLTKRDYAQFHAEFENHAEMENSKAKPIRLLNCTEGGAYIKGFEHIPLAEAITDINASQSAMSDITSHFKAAQADVDVAGRRKLLAQRLQQAKASLEKSYQLAVRCAKVATQVEKAKVKVSALTKAEADLSRAIAGSAFIALVDQTEINNAIQIGMHAKTIQQSLAASRVLYTLVMREVPNILPKVNTALVKLDQAHAH